MITNRGEYSAREENSLDNAPSFSGNWPIVPWVSVFGHQQTQLCGSLNSPLVFPQFNADLRIVYKSMMYGTIYYHFLDLYCCITIHQNVQIGDIAVVHYTLDQRVPVDL